MYAIPFVAARVLTSSHSLCITYTFFFCINTENPYTLLRLVDLPNFFFFFYNVVQSTSTSKIMCVVGLW